MIFENRFDGGCFADVSLGSGGAMSIDVADGLWGHSCGAQSHVHAACSAFTIRRW